MSISNNKDIQSNTTNNPSWNIPDYQLSCLICDTINYIAPYEQIPLVYLCPNCKSKLKEFVNAN